MTESPKGPSAKQRRTLSPFAGVPAETGVKPDKQRQDESAVSNAATPPTRQATVPVTSLWPAHVLVEGTPSGAVYEWPRAGAVVSVRLEDLEFLRAKNHYSGRACCGGSGDRIMFQFPSETLSGGFPTD